MDYSILHSFRSLARRGSFATSSELMTLNNFCELESHFNSFHDMFIVKTLCFNSVGSKSFPVSRIPRQSDSKPLLFVRPTLHILTWATWITWYIIKSFSFGGGSIPSVFQVMG
jgi:hypothetical protein